MNEGMFLAILKEAGLPLPIREYCFHPSRRWRFDWAWLDYRVALEWEGGTWSGGRHVRGKGYEEDCRKYSEAAILGWRVLRVTTAMLDRGEVVDLLKRALCDKK